MERTLLLVDDEENILRALRRLLRRQGYRILTASSGQAGLELLQTESVCVVVSDQRMPQMSGIDFLQRVRDLYPQTIRIILSGYTDLDSVTDSINTGAVHKFLTKPWDDEQLSKHVAEAFEVFELQGENQRLNEELMRANQKLEARVEEESRASAFSLQALRVAQDILEELPLAVLGISEGQVVVANRVARICLAETPMLLGMEVADVLPAPLLEVYRQACDTGQPARGRWPCHGSARCGQREFRVLCKINESSGAHKGYILTWSGHSEEEERLGV